MSDRPKRVVVGVTGASGSIYAHRLLHHLHELQVQTHLIVTGAARMTMAYELGKEHSFPPVHETHPIGNVGASIASGSFQTDGMIIAPCSIKTMSEIATGVTSNLLTRAADVCLKERRPLVLMVRETPFHLGHLRTMTALAEMGAIIAPPLPAFYANPSSIEDLVDQSVLRALDYVNVETDALRRWGESDPTSASQGKVT